MKNKIKILALSLTFALTAYQINAQQKLAQTGMKFLNVSLDARSSALSEAVTSFHTDATAMFYNPAGMARISNYVSVVVGTTNYIADIKYLYGGVAFAPFDGNYGVVGINFESVDYGDLQATIRYNNDQGYLDAGTFSPTALAVGVGYAKALSDKFSIGGNIKYVRQSLGTAIVGGVQVGAGNTPTGRTVEAKTDVIAYDFGVIYKTGFKSLDFGMNVRNFSREVKYVQDGFQLPLTFKIGISFDAMDLLNDVDKDMHSLLLSFDASHPRDYPEQAAFGVEYTFMKTLSLRVGYQTPTDEKGISAGVGFKHSFAGFDFAVDYAYTSFGVFNNVQQISVRFAY
ncbi:PorV/PorQ family protein [Melioribacteraceae bacterium 4301-Me]|uniref:PorV/PorQ family protein n=1 Tax=Pyranulibacter aquaticus TaxID=3163344 RepID=UPI0035986660